mmetsp:Transcript_41632/g.46391  ORF Transcript_41632/g.46391 Transcript_41632/m.46391 type:complete len:173 (+) Transcript_41632:143-661(+)
MSVLFYYSFLSLLLVSPFFRFVSLCSSSLSGTVTASSRISYWMIIGTYLHFYCTVLSHYSILEKPKKHTGRYVGGNNTNTNTNGQTKDPKSTLQQQHAVCVWSSPTCVMDGALLQLKVDNDFDDTSILSSSSSVGSGSGSGSGELVDMCWSDRDARHALSVHTRMVQLYYGI